MSIVQISRLGFWSTIMLLRFIFLYFSGLKVQVFSNVLSFPNSAFGFQFRIDNWEIGSYFTIAFVHQYESYSTKYLSGYLIGRFSIQENKILDFNQEI